MLYSLILLWRLDALVSCCKCLSLIDKTTRPIMPIVAMAFNIPVSCVYIYYCRNVLEVHKYFSVCVKQTQSLFCKLFLPIHHMVSLVIKHVSFYDAIWCLVIKELIVNLTG